MNELPDWAIESAKSETPISFAKRLIGASCGGFVFCFVALMVCHSAMDQLGIQGATVLSIAALIFGAIGGFAFPRLSHFLGYAFLFFINVLLSITLAGNMKEQSTLFLLFACIEFAFYLSRIEIKA